MSLKKKIIIIGFTILLILTFIVFYQIKSRQNLVTPSPTPSQSQARFKDLAPGTSNLDDVKNTLGVPINERLEENKTVLEYKSDNPNFNNELTIESNKLELIKRQVTSSDTIDINKIEDEYGATEKVLYGPLSSNGFNLYIYPDRGFAYIGNPYSGIIFEIWYFTPTDFNIFKYKYAGNYSEKYLPSQ